MRLAHRSRPHDASRQRGGSDENDHRHRGTGLGRRHARCPEPPTSRAEEEAPEGTIAFSSLAPRGWDLYLTDVASRQTRRLTDHPALDFNAAFAADGRPLAFVSTATATPSFTPSKPTASAWRLTDEFAMDDHPAWSPDGRRLAFSSTRQPGDRPGRAWNAVYVMDVEPGDAGPRRLTPAGVGRLFAGLVAQGRPDRRRLGQRKQRAAPICSSWRPTAPAGGGSCRTAAGRPSRPTGGRCSSTANATGKWGIWRVGLDGSGLERITPAGRRRLHALRLRRRQAAGRGRQRDGHRQIVLVDLASHSLTDLTDEPTDHWNPSISPDGRSVVLPQDHPRTSRPQCRALGRAARYGAAAAPAGRGLPGLLARRPARWP